MTVGLFQDLDPGTSIADVYGITESSDVTSHATGFHRLLLANPAYRPVRAAHGQQGLRSYRHDVSAARTVAAAQARKLHFWQHQLRKRGTGALRQPVHD